jgi:hypothetical protein
MNDFTRQKLLENMRVRGLRPELNAKYAKTDREWLRKIGNIRAMPHVFSS